MVIALVEIARGFADAIDETISNCFLEIFGVHVCCDGLPNREPGNDGVEPRLSEEDSEGKVQSVLRYRRGRSITLDSKDDILEEGDVKHPFDRSQWDLSLLNG